MNNMSLSMVSLIHYNNIIRDTLQYTLNHQTYDVKAFELRKKVLMEGLKEGTMLKAFIEQNKEAGKKIEDRINALYALVYADDSTICRVANNELRVDQGQHIAILEAVIPLHEDIARVIGAYLNLARKQNLYEDELVKLLAADERMYRSVAYMSLYHELERLFVEYNKARNEAKGQITPQSNFIQGELSKVYNLISFTYNTQHATDLETWKVGDFLLALVQQITARRELPAGRKFQDMFSEGRALVDERVKQTTPESQTLMKAAIDELNAAMKANNGKLEIKFNQEQKPEEKKN